MIGHKRVRRPVLKWAIAGLIVVISGGILFVSSGFGYQDHIWNLGMALHLLLLGVCVATAGILLCAFGLIRMKRKADVLISSVGIVFGLIVIAVFFHFYTVARNAPPIHDITTDTLHPPQFEAVLSLRKNSQNSCEYGGKRVAEMQEQAYPYIKPLVLDVSFEDAFRKALTVARKMRYWKIVNSNATAGRIEATVTVPWFGFKDDVVVRVSSIDTSRTQVDVRSESRTGKNDYGINARRIHTYLTLVRKTSGTSDP